MNEKQKSVFVKVGVVVIIIVVLIIFDTTTSPKCPGCGKKWDGAATIKYCFECQAKQAQPPTNSGNSYHPSSIPTNCTYQNCPDNTMNGSKYCSRHTCKVDGCNEKVHDPIIGYCSTHERSETCAESGCYRTRYRAKDSIYCTIHYGDHLK